MKLKVLHIFIALAIIFVPLYSSGQTRAQGIITWSANSYAPSTFIGKILPSSGSELKASLMIVKSGEVMDISKSQINWFVDGELHKSGVGLRSIYITAPTKNGLLRIRAQAEDVNGLSISKTIEIPLVTPEAIISKNFSGNTFSNPKIAIKAKPFFFNSKEDSLSYTWKINQEEPVISNENNLLISLGDNLENNFRAQISLTIKSDFPREKATSIKNFIYKNE